MGRLFNKVSDDGIPHGKAGCRHVHCVVGKGAYQRVVTSSAGYGAQAALCVKDFKNQTGVVCQSAHYG